MNESVACQMDIYFTPPKLELLKYLNLQYERRFMSLLVGDIGLVPLMKKSAVYTGVNHCQYKKLLNAPTGIRTRVVGLEGPSHNR
jgi:hypothetical protein